LNRAFDPPKRVPCTSKDGIWVQELSCYVMALDPQPAKDHPVWGGRPDGAVYRCVVSQPYYRQSYIWLATAPTVRVDPEVLAERAVKSMGLRRVAVGLAPKPGPASYGLVGAPVYMWVADAGPQTTGPQALSVSAGGVTVTVEARVQQVVWQMGDGATVTCRGAGTPYQDSYGSRPSPTCGHRYERPSDGRPGGVYPVTATTYWRADWAGGGESGFFEFTFSTPTTVRITEAQALVS
jgi:hypothetical protein